MKNVHQLRIRLRDMQQKTGEAAQKAASLAAENAWREAQKRAPVRTGRLQASLQKAGQDGKYRVLTRCPYALFVERGTRRMGAQPYLTPAFLQAVQRTPFDLIFWEMIV